MEDLLEILKGQIKVKAPHANYKRVCDLAILYSQVISGKDIDDLLEQFVPREDKIMFEQRKNLTQQITPSLCSGIITEFNKVFRTKPARENLTFEPENDKAVKEVREALATIYGDKDVYKYMQDRFLYLTFSDPNAFIYTTFKDFDSKEGKPEPYNMEITSPEAWNYEYFNNDLLWLVSRVCIKYVEQGKENDGYIWTIYGANFSYVMTQVGSDYLAINGEEIVRIVLDEDNKKYEYFILEIHEHKSELIPVFQVGYKRDLQTHGETFVSPIEPGMPYLLKSIKAVSEFDLSMALHAFPQKFQFVDYCELDPVGNCPTSGCLVSKCTKCNGTGIPPIHTSAQDAVIMKLPKDKEDMFDLQQLVHYEHPPVDILEFQDMIIDKYGVKFHKSIFNSETFTKDEVAKTATGENIDMQNVYDTLKPFAERVSDLWEHEAHVVSYYLDFKNPVADHAYPDDFKLKGIDQLIEELNKASTGGASGYITTGIESDIMRQMYIDSPLEFEKYQVKQKHYPFLGKSKDEVQQIILGGNVRKRDIILYNYFEAIFLRAEEEKEDFYKLTTKLQREIIDKIIEEIDSEINEQNAIEFDTVS